MESALRRVGQAFIKIPAVKLAYLFGSHAKGQASKKSDVDIAVLLQEPVRDHLKIKLEILASLEDIFQKEVDLTTLNTAGSILKYQVVKNGQLLFERNPGDHKKFQIAS